MVRFMVNNKLCSSQTFRFTTLCWGSFVFSPTCEPHCFLSICPLLVLRVLQGEYRRLKWKHAEAASVPMLTEAGEGGPGSPTAEGQQDEELLAEARVLRQHKTRLETRMQILEDHNKQLESQLRRLRELLLQVIYTICCCPDWRSVHTVHFLIYRSYIYCY